MNLGNIVKKIKEEKDPINEMGMFVYIRKGKIGVTTPADRLRRKRYYKAHKGAIKARMRVYSRSIKGMKSRRRQKRYRRMWGAKYARFKRR